MKHSQTTVNGQRVMHLRQKPYSHDVRSEKFTAKALGFGAIEQIVKTLGRPRATPLDQGDSLFCAEYAGAMNGRYIHGINFSTDWQINKVGRLQGRDVSVNGSDANSAMDSQTYSKQGGYLPIEDWNSLKAEVLDQEAINYSNSAYIKANGGKDIFDSMCIELQRHYGFPTKLGACIQLFTGWYDTFMGGEITTIGNLQGWHSYLAIDFDRSDQDERKHYLILQNSYGEHIGDMGFHKMYRPLVNELLAKRGTTHKIPSPLSKDQIALAKQSTPYGNIQRLIIQAWYNLTLLLVKLYG